MRKQWVLVGILAGSLDGRPCVRAAQGAEPAAGDRRRTGEPRRATLALGTVRLPKGTTADGKPLPAGTYQVRLTAEEAKPDARGASENIERWVEFVQKGAVKGREVVSIVPQARSRTSSKDAPPPPAARRSRCSRATTTCASGSTRAGITT